MEERRVINATVSFHASFPFEGKGSQWKYALIQLIKKLC
jgi:hypothetical protein